MGPRPNPQHLIRLVFLCPAFSQREADALLTIPIADRHAIRAALILAPVIARHHAAASAHGIADVLRP